MEGGIILAVEIKFKTPTINHTPFPKETIHERLIADKAIDYRNNYRIVNLPDGYQIVEPIDKNKLWK